MNESLFLFLLLSILVLIIAAVIVVIELMKSKSIRVPSLVILFVILLNVVNSIISIYPKYRDNSLEEWIYTIPKEFNNFLEANSEDLYRLFVTLCHFLMFFIFFHYVHKWTPKLKPKVCKYYEALEGWLQEWHKKSRAQKKETIIKFFIRKIEEIAERMVKILYAFFLIVVEFFVSLLVIILCPIGFIFEISFEVVKIMWNRVKNLKKINKKHGDLVEGPIKFFVRRLFTYVLKFFRTLFFGIADKRMYLKPLLLVWFFITLLKDMLRLNLTLSFDYTPHLTHHNEMVHMGLLFMVFNSYLFIIVTIGALNMIRQHKVSYLLCILTLHTVINIAFYTVNILTFFMSFEFIVVPMYFLIIKWGSRSWEKIRAVNLLFIFTVFSGIFMLLGIMKIWTELGDLNVLRLYKWGLASHPCSSWTYYVFICFAFTFSVKLPLMPFHIWLTQAHVEAPMAGSVILAGILLKLGGYGFIKYGLMLWPQEFTKLCPFFKVVCLFSIFIGSICTCVQVDIKRLIAYSSVVHMAMCIYPLFNSPENGGINSCVIGMISHGLISPGLFLMVGFMYERTHSRNILYYGGYSLILPVLSGMGLLIILSSMGVPGTLNFIGEVFMLLNVMGGSSVIAVVVLGFGMFATLIYSLKVYTYVFSGLPISNLNYENKEVFPYDLRLNEFTSLVLCTFPILVCGVHTPIWLYIIH